MFARGSQYSEHYLQSFHAYFCIVAACKNAKVIVQNVITDPNIMKLHYLLSHKIFKKYCNKKTIFVVEIERELLACSRRQQNPLSTCYC